MHLASGLDRPVHDILYQIYRIKVLYTGGQAIDRVIVISQIAQIKADEAQILQSGRQYRRLGSGKLYDLRE